MYNYERVLVLGDIWEESSPIGFVVISGDFYSSSQKHDKYICCLQLSIITDETKGGGGENRRKSCLTSWHMLLKDRAILTMFSDLH